MKTWLVLVLITAGSSFCEDVHHSNYFLSDDFINQINSANLTWKAKRNFDPSTSLDTLHNLVGVLPDADIHQLPYKESKQGVKNIPAQFNAQEEWPECPSIVEIFNQGPCSCGGWACATATTMTDRLCIHSKGDIQVQVSVQNLLSCAPGDGCHGGSVLEAWQFWIETGLVSGGPYGSGEGCQPYKYWPFPTKTVLMNKSMYSTPECHKYCDNTSISYEQDKTYGKDAYRVDGSVEEIQKEIMDNGPVVAIFYVYYDFCYYKNGVYKHDPSKPGGLGHYAVKLLGWGEENGMPYWLGANSWGHTWGDQGLFKIIRGEDHCGIEGKVTAGLPRL